MRLNERVETKLALGSDVTLVVITEREPLHLDELFTSLWRAIFLFEQQCSRFLPASELSMFNRSAGQKTAVSSTFRDILQQARAISRKTGGLFNPFILPALQRTGYVASALAGYELDESDNYAKREVVSVNNLQIGDDWAKIPYGTAVDLGGCGKGYLAEQLRQLVAPYEVEGYWFSLGGDIAMSGVDVFGEARVVGIQDASNPQKELTDQIHCPLDDYAVATSGTLHRTAHAKTGAWHHIIDPRTLQPADTDIQLVTVAMASAFDADVLASCAVILGSTKAPEFLQKLGVTSYVIQAKKGVLVHA